MDASTVGFLIPVFAILMGVSIPITAIKLKHRERLEQMRMAAGRGPDNARTAQQDGRIEMLEDRVQVLERIITDRGFNVAAQIEALRDSSSIEELTRERSKAL